MTSELKVIWPKLVLVHGALGHLQNQGSVERANGNNTTDWSVGINFDHFQKKIQFACWYSPVPICSHVGYKTKVGLASSYLLGELIQRMQCEDDLLVVLTTEQRGEEPVLFTLLNHCCGTC